MIREGAGPYPDIAALTGDDGGFRFDDLVPGNYTVLAQLDSGLVRDIIPAQSEPDAASFVTAQAGCLSQAQIRQAVASGQARRLSEFYGRISQATGSAQVLPGPQLCWSGNALVYIVNVLSGNGSVRTVTINASNGTILSY